MNVILKTILSNIIGPIINWTVDQIFGGNSATSSQGIKAFASQFLGVVKEIHFDWNTTYALFARQRNAYIKLPRDYGRVGQDLAKVGAEHRATWDDFLSGVYAADMRLLQDEIRTKAPKSAAQGVTVLDRQVSRLDKSIAVLQAWRKSTADPELRQWEQFRAAWNKTYGPIVNRWGLWFSTPSDFAAWAVGPLVAYLSAVPGTSAQKQARDILSSAMLQGWNERPELTWQAIQTWLVTEY